MPPANALSQDSVFAGGGAAGGVSALLRGTLFVRPKDVVWVFVIWCNLRSARWNRKVVFGNLGARWGPKDVWDEIVVKTPGRSLRPGSRPGRPGCSMGQKLSKSDTLSMTALY